MIVYIAEGFLEGPLHSRKMREMLRTQGHIVSTSPSRADVIISHSAGWCFLPPLKASQRLVLLDPAFDDGRSLLLRSMERGIHDVRHFRISMLPERILNIWYLFALLPRWIRLYRIIHTRSIIPLLMREHTFVMGVTGSSWWDERTMVKTGVAYETIRGDHDIFWSHPHLIDYLR